MLSFLVAAALQTSSFLIDLFLHVRIRGIYRFCVYVALTLTMMILAYQGQYTVTVLHPSVELASQIRQLFGGYFNYAQYQFPYTFGEITTANDFYNWLRGPFLGVLTSGTLNRNDASSYSNMPTQLNKPNINISQDTYSAIKEEPLAYGVWAIPACKIRQVTYQMSLISQ